MSTFSTAAGTFDTATTTWLTALLAFQVAAQVVQTADVSQYKSYGSNILGQMGGTGPAIAQKLAAYPEWIQFCDEVGCPELYQRYAQGGIAGSHNPLTVLATVFAAA